MNTIYEPAGLAREYAPLALNIYRGCTHNCAYCYVPGMLREDAGNFHASAKVRPGLMQALPAAARKFASDPRRVHLCFTCDPWPNPELFEDGELDYTGEVLQILADFDLKISTLTKAPLRAERHFRQLKACDAHFGVSLVWTDDALRQQWEPGSAGEVGLSVPDRLEGLFRAKEAGLYTWASVEPVVDPEQGLATIRMLMDIVDEIKVGRLNHMATPAPVNWAAFANAADGLLRSWGRPYILKSGLKELL